MEKENSAPQMPESLGASIWRNLDLGKHGLSETPYPRWKLVFNTDVPQSFLSEEERLLRGFYLLSLATGPQS